jgi:hypothetical protein
MMLTLIAIGDRLGSFLIRLFLLGSALIALPRFENPRLARASTAT